MTTTKKLTAAQVKALATIASCGTITIGVVPSVKVLIRNGLVVEREVPAYSWMPHYVLTEAGAEASGVAYAAYCAVLGLVDAALQLRSNAAHRDLEARRAARLAAQA